MTLATMPDPRPLELAELRAAAELALSEIGDGAALTQLEKALIALGVAASVTSLDRSAIEAKITDAFEANASVDQVQETVSLVSGLGVHSLMATAASIVAAAQRAGRPIPTELTPEQVALWDKHVGDDPFWTGFEREFPGFLRSMLLLSRDQFVAFFDYCAVPWKIGTLRARLKELISMASDATPSHRFLPGFRLHLHNAIKLGAGRLAITQALEIAAASPLHSGTR